MEKIMIVDNDTITKGARMTGRLKNDPIGAICSTNSRRVRANHDVALLTRGLLPGEQQGLAPADTSDAFPLVQCGACSDFIDRM
jgi:hypothetical protein